MGNWTNNPWAIPVTSDTDVEEKIRKNEDVSDDFSVEESDLD